MGQYVLGLAGAPPLRLNLLDSSFISSLSGGSMWPVASVLYTCLTVSFPIFAAQPFPIPGQPSFYLSPHIFDFTRQQKESV